MTRNEDFMSNDHDQRAECAAAIATLDARLGALLETQRRQNGQLGVVAEKLTEVRIEIGSKLSEIEADLDAFRQHSEDFESDIRSYRAEREHRESEPRSQPISVPASPTIEATLGISLWKFLLMLVGLVIIAGMGIEGARWFMSRGGGIPTEGHVVTSPAHPTPTSHPEHDP